MFYVHWFVDVKILQTYSWKDGILKWTERESCKRLTRALEKVDGMPRSKMSDDSVKADVDQVKDNGDYSRRFQGSDFLVKGLIDIVVFVSF